MSVRNLHSCQENVCAAAAHGAVQDCLNDAHAAHAEMSDQYDEIAGQQARVAAVLALEMVVASHAYIWECLSRAML